MPILSRLSIVLGAVAFTFACGSSESKPAPTTEPVVEHETAVAAIREPAPPAGSQTPPAAANGDLPPHALAQHAIAKCVDDFFYDGGYNEGDPVREGLITDVLALKGLPPYSQALDDKVERDRPKGGSEEYLTVYQWCLGQSSKIAELATKRGLELPSP